MPSVVLRQTAGIDEAIIPAFLLLYAVAVSIERFTLGQDSHGEDVHELPADGKWRMPSLAMPQEQWGPVPCGRRAFPKLRFVAREKLSISVFSRPPSQFCIETVRHSRTSSGPDRHPSLAPHRRIWTAGFREQSASLAPVGSHTPVGEDSAPLLGMYRMDREYRRDRLIKCAWSSDEGPEPDEGWTHSER